MTAKITIEDEFGVIETISFTKVHDLKTANIINYITGNTKEMTEKVE